MKKKLLSHVKIDRLRKMEKDEKDPKAKMILLACIAKKEGKDLKDIAKALNKPYNTVRGWINRMYLFKSCLDFTVKRCRLRTKLCHNLNKYAYLIWILNSLNQSGTRLLVNKDLSPSQIDLEKNLGYDEFVTVL